MTRVLVTGGTGFVGRRLVRALIAGGYTVRLATRAVMAPPRPDVEIVPVGPIGSRTDWREALSGVEHVVHAAAMVHVMRPADGDERAFHEVNALGTEALARAAAFSGVRRFILLSTVKVLGEESGDRPLRDDDPPRPHDAYARSKYEGEERAAGAAVGAGMELVVLRPPLVYGPGVKGNFATLLRLCDSGLPLPLGAVRNRRSLIYVDNLVEAIIAALAHRGSLSGRFLVSDGEAVSTPELIRALGAALGRPARLIPVPSGLLRLTAKAFGLRPAVERLIGSLAVDDGRFRASTGWAPNAKFEDGLRATAAWWRAGRGR
ncbi:MAG TPA: NAD-dependent epimerase/dehydratase family protein [Alphaproteobacteria bacterium]